MTGPIVTRSTQWKSVILLCGKCARKMDGGYGPKAKETLRAVLRDAFRANGHHREFRIIETRCMGICPNKAVTALNASRPDRILTIPRYTAAEEAMARLMSQSDE